MLLKEQNLHLTIVAYLLYSQAISVHLYDKLANRQTDGQYLYRVDAQ